MENDIAGDPISGLKWTKKSPEKISKELAANYQINISHNTIRSILTELGYSLKINYKKIEYNKIVTMQEKRLRNEQFLYIQKQKNYYQRNNYGAISVDAKKKEYIGNFKNNGKCWSKNNKIVNAYDFPSWAHGVGIPYGIYDIWLKQGFVIIGTSYNTPEFAVSSVKQWWEIIGYKHYDKTKKILILADGGGSNGWRTRFWKFGLQNEICDQYGVDVSVSHYPTGTSKYNPIEHLLFSQISNNWTGQPLLNYEVMLNYIATTKTNTGLSVKALLDNNVYQKGIKITDKQMKSLNIKYHNTIPKWNYTISPQ